jgi:hypothetical protein
MFLFQASGISSFQIQPKPIQGIIFVAGLVAIIFLIVYVNKSKKIKNNPIFKTGTIDKTELTALSVKGIGKIARKYELDASEQKALAKLLHDAELDIDAVFNSTGDIDSAFARMASTLAREDDSEQMIEKLFAIRNKVEYYSLVNETADSPGKNKIPRRYRRKKTNIPVSFYLVVVIESRQGSKKVKKLSLDNKKLSGMLLDLSAGGCSISTRDPVKAGGRIKIEFKIGKASLAALAMILRINKGPSGNILHARFIKTPVKTLNAINAFIFGYKDI